MTADEKAALRALHRAFGRYVKGYIKDEKGRISWPVAVKAVHSQRVRKNAVAIARALSAEGRIRLMAAACGLYHDLGRFEQYRRWRTFKDQDSADHGALSAEILENNRARFLQVFFPAGQESVIFAVRHHNRLRMPDSAEPDAMLLLRICRDADKLDIWRVFDELLTGRLRKGAYTINHGLPEGGPVSRKVLDAVMAGRMVEYRHIRNQADFAVMRLSWVFDMNFAWTLRQVVERGYLNRIKNVIPMTTECREMFRRVEQYLEENAAGDEVLKRGKEQ